MRKIIKRIIAFSSIFSTSLLNSCAEAYYEPYPIEEKMYFDVNNNIRYQYVKFEAGQVFSNYKATIEINVIDTFQLPDDFKFGEDNCLSFIIPYNSELNNFYIEGKQHTSARRLVRRIDYNNCINSRDDRWGGDTFIFDSTNLCLRYGQNNGLISDISEELTVNLIFSKDFMVFGNDSCYFFRGTPGVSTLDFEVYFWDTLDYLDNYNYDTFDGVNFIEKMKDQTKIVKEKDLIKINAYWEDGSEISLFHPYVDLDYFYYGPVDDSYEQIV